MNCIISCPPHHHIESICTENVKIPRTHFERKWISFCVISEKAIGYKSKDLLLSLKPVVFWSDKVYSKPTIAVRSILSDLWKGGREKYKQLGSTREPEVSMNFAVFLFRSETVPFGPCNTESSRRRRRTCVRNNVYVYARLRWPAAAAESSVVAGPEPCERDGKKKNKSEIALREWERENIYCSAGARG